MSADEITGMTLEGVAEAIRTRRGAATAEKGRSFHEAVVDRLVGIIDYLKKVPLDVRRRPAPFD